MSWNEFTRRAPKCHRCGHAAVWDEWGSWWEDRWDDRRGRYGQRVWGARPICGFCQGTHCDRGVWSRLHWSPGRLLSAWRRGEFDHVVQRVCGGPLRTVTGAGDSRGRVADAP